MLLLPPAPAALVLAGRAFAILSALSAAAFLRIAVAGPPGALGETGRAVVEPVDGELIGEEGRGEDCRNTSISPVKPLVTTRSHRACSCALAAHASTCSASAGGIAAPAEVLCAHHFGRPGLRRGCYSDCEVDYLVESGGSKQR